MMSKFNFEPEIKWDELCKAGEELKKTAEEDFRRIVMPAVKQAEDHVKEAIISYLSVMGGFIFGKPISKEKLKDREYIQKLMNECFQDNDSATQIISMLNAFLGDQAKRIPQGLRTGQIEYHLIDPENPGDPEDYFRLGVDHAWREEPVSKHLLIKTFLQTDEEAGGTGQNRRAMLGWLEGDEYWHNGVRGEYKDVGTCTNPPREYAVQTVLIKTQSDIRVRKGDWDYDQMLLEER